MQVSSIQHSRMDPEKSTVKLEERIETRANAFNSLGGTTTVPDCGLPTGLVGVYRAAMRASCSPPDALERVSPLACSFWLTNDRVPGRPSPAQVPPVILAASDPLIRIQYSGSFPFTPGGQAARLTILLPG